MAINCGLDLYFEGGYYNFLIDISQNKYNNNNNNNFKLFAVFNIKILSYIKKYKINYTVKNNKINVLLKYEDINNINNYKFIKKLFVFVAKNKYTKYCMVLSTKHDYYDIINNNNNIYTKNSFYFYNDNFYLSINHCYKLLVLRIENMKNKENKENIIINNIMKKYFYYNIIILYNNFNTTKYLSNTKKLQAILLSILECYTYSIAKFKIFISINKTSDDYDEKELKKIINNVKIPVNAKKQSIQLSITCQNINKYISCKKNILRYFFILYIIF